MYSKIQGTVPVALREMLDELLSQEVINPRQLSAAVARPTITREDLRGFIHFQNDEFSIEPIWNCSRLEINCISWRAGQASTLHHHAVSDCCVRVIDGQLTNQDLVPDGAEYKCRITHLDAGQILVRQHRQIHRLSNESTEDLVTLHVYSPPLVPLAQRLVRA